MNHPNLETNKLGHPHFAFDTLPSTSQYLKDWVRDRHRPAPSKGALVSARVQTSGYGQHGRTWSAVPGKSLSFSLWIPGIPVPHLTIRAALGMAVALDSFVPPGMVGLKWVNDLVIEGRKLGGILAEGLSGGSPDRTGTVLGIGLNLDAPPDIPHATGLLAHLPSMGQNPPLAEPSADALMAAMMHQLGIWLDTDRDPVASYRQRMCHLGQRVTLEQGAQLLEGIARDLDDQGNLLLELDDGSSIRCHAGTLRLADGRYA